MLINYEIEITLSHIISLAVVQHINGIIPLLKGTVPILRPQTCVSKANLFIRIFLTLA